MEARTLIRADAAVEGALGAALVVGGMSGGLAGAEAAISQPVPTLRR